MAALIQPEDLLGGGLDIDGWSYLKQDAEHRRCADLTDKTYVQRQQGGNSTDIFIITELFQNLVTDLNHVCSCDACLHLYYGCSGTAPRCAP